MLVVQIPKQNEKLNLHSFLITIINPPLWRIFYFKHLSNLFSSTIINQIDFKKTHK